MNQEIGRIKRDLETIQGAMGLSPSIGRDWVQWMKRDQWFSLWWCLPGLILICSALLPLQSGGKLLGLVSSQWTGVLVALILLGIAVAHSRKVSANDGRPAALIRECKRLNGMSREGMWFGSSLLVQVLLYFLWINYYHISFEAFWAGLFLLVGSTCLVAAVSTRAWTLLGWGVPFLAYGLSLLLAGARPKAQGVLLGLMFIAVALSFSVIQVWQIRRIERSHESD
jgi:hypothetical protein